MTVSSNTSSACSIWLRHNLANFKLRLKALEEKLANDNNLVLTEAHLQALEKKKLDDEASGEIETHHPGYLRSQDTYYLGTIKGVGRIYQQTYVDTYSGVAQAKLALGLFIFLGQRRGDTVALGWDNVINDELIHLVQEKAGKELFIPINPDLKDLLGRVPEDQSRFLQTQQGKPFSPKGFGNRMRKWCDEAGLPDCSSHGLRKAASRRLAEAGCSAKEIMAITGHTTLQEVDRYTKAVDQVALAKKALNKLG